MTRLLVAGSLTRWASMAHHSNARAVSYKQRRRVHDVCGVRLSDLGQPRLGRAQLRFRHGNEGFQVFPV